MMQSEVTPYNNAAVHKAKHSGPGIASFIITLISIFCFVIGLASSITAGVLEEAYTVAANPEEQLGYVVGGLFILLSGVLCFIGLILGIVGLSVQNRKKIFAILGTVFSGIGLLIIAVILLLSW